jgi:2-polyprenyl-3-methyl-5-hydroxy-6-metoxy-1,4-benzoquinol methylase
MGFLAWDNNTYYHERLLRALPRPCERVLDVGCGKGVFATKLARRARQVDALDASAEMIEQAKARVPDNVTCLLGDVNEIALAEYDAITSISVLHHLDLAEVLPKLAAALRPGGRLVAVALFRFDLPREAPALATTLLTMYGRRALLLAVPSARRYRRTLDQSGMPVRDPVLSVSEVRAQVARVLPGARVRRLRQLRYELRYDKPANR